MADQAHLTVLLNNPILDAHAAEHMEEIRRSNLPNVLSLAAETNAHNKDYVRWLKVRLASGSDQDLATWLAQKPSTTIMKYQAYDINGNTFYTEERDAKTSYQNSSVGIECLTVEEDDKQVYYGTIEEIWELDYVQMKVALFKCR